MDTEIFHNPTSEYRGKPFWSWNGELEKDELIRQIEIMKIMGMGGYFCHSRTGLITEYLGDEWFDMINACADKGNEIGMETWLYDEDRWPSGTAGGMVTQNPEYRINYIRLNIKNSTEFLFTDDIISAFTANLDGFSFNNKKKIFKGDKITGKDVIYFTLEEMGKSSFYNGFTYVDTMNLDATNKFIQLTHNKYKKKCGDKFGKEITGIFTDEPHRGGVMCGFSLPNENGGYLTPYTNSLFNDFKIAYDFDLIDYLPELFLWKDGEKIHPVKWKYMELIQQLFIKNYFNPIQEWCKENNMTLTGHVLNEDSLTAQTCMIGSVMRAYEYMDIPGIDVLTENNYNFWIAKQLQSASRQLGKNKSLSELYGCTGWQTNFQSHKEIGDWQTLFGVNFRCHHLSWYSMQGEAKRDYPASILHQSAWWKDYYYVENYFSRIGYLMSLGNSICNVLVINPVESVWSQIYANWSNNLSIDDKDVQKLEEIYAELFYVLCRNKIDFDYGDEDFILRLSSIISEGGKAYLKIGRCRYEFVLIAGMVTIRQTTLDVLKEFISCGGKVIFAGEIPKYVDAVRNDSVELVNAIKIKNEPSEIVNYLSSSKMIEIVDYSTGENIEDIYVSINKENQNHIIMILNINREVKFKKLVIKINRGGYLEEWNPRTGEKQLLSTGVDNLIYITDLSPGEEILLVATDKNNEYPKKAKFKFIKEELLIGGYTYSLDEPNVCVLDFAKCIINGEIVVEQDEILKIDRVLRKRYNMPLRGGEMVQPWFGDKIQPIEYENISLIFDFYIKNIPKEIYLVIETPLEFFIKMNDVEVNEITDIFWVDKCFKVLKLPNCLIEGKNQILISCKFRENINLESLYIIGDFGVSLDGLTKTLIKLPERLYTGDITGQGLPFYGSRIKCIINTNFGKTSDKTIMLATDESDCACIKISNNEESRYIAFKPYEIDITDMLDKGDIIAEFVFTRKNTFGPLHRNPIKANACGPDSFKTEAESFLSNNYGLIPQNINLKFRIYERI